MYQNSLDFSVHHLEETSLDYDILFLAPASGSNFLSMEMQMIKPFMKLRYTETIELLMHSKKVTSFPQMYSATP